MTKSLTAALDAMLAPRPPAQPNPPAGQMAPRIRTNTALGLSAKQRVELMQAPLWLYTLCRNLHAARHEPAGRHVTDRAAWTLMDEFRLQWEDVLADLEDDEAEALYRQAHALADRGFDVIEGGDMPTTVRAIKLFVDELGRRNRLPDIAPELFRLAWDTLRGIAYATPEDMAEIIRVAAPARKAASAIVQYYEGAGYLLEGCR